MNTRTSYRLRLWQILVVEELQTNKRRLRQQNYRPVQLKNIMFIATSVTTGLKDQNNQLNAVCHNHVSGVAQFNP